ncbi:MAG TPA: hypothetical protein PKA64_15960 [Myxococcota bacterium]|nr:hypothetical protein [Myxococcota bacterium]
MRLSVALLATACQATSTLPAATFDPAGGFFDTPWPSDARRTAEGASDWSGFPNPTGTELLDTYLAATRLRTGAALNAPMYVRFDGDIAIDAVPGGAETAGLASPIQLADVDPRSPTFGQRVPVDWEWLANDASYHPARVLSVAPIEGFPLRPLTTYALVITAALASRPDAFDAAWSGDGAFADSLAPLRDALPFLGLDERDVAVATVFTTMDATEPMDHVARFVLDHVQPAVFQHDLEALDDLGPYEVLRSNYMTPMFMSGAPPWADEGGAFVFADDGTPEIQRWEPMRLSVVVPKDQAEPADGWPVLISLHGTGGDYRTFCNSTSDMEIATWATGMGVLGLSIDLPLHGAREAPGTVIDLHSFNVLQPDSALHIHRQAAADALFLLRGIVDHEAAYGEPLTFNHPDGRVLHLDTSRVAIIGHSQGGITTALALPWMGERLQAAVMSGTGGLLAITAVERDNDYDIPTLIRSLLDFQDDEELTEKHPVLGLVQSLVEITDPINYGRYWFSEDGGLAGASPTDVLMTSGLRDDMTPYRTSEALAAAASAPFAGRRWSAATGMLLRGLDARRLPVEDDMYGWDGEPITAGLSQWNDGTHFVIFEEPAARDVARNFVWSALIEDSPRIFAGDLPQP